MEARKFRHAVTSTPAAAKRHRCVDKHEQLAKHSGRKSSISSTDKDKDERATRQGAGT